MKFKSQNVPFWEAAIQCQQNLHTLHQPEMSILIIFWWLIIMTCHQVGHSPLSRGETRSHWMLTVNGVMGSVADGADGGNSTPPLTKLCTPNPQLHPMSCNDTIHNLNGRHHEISIARADHFIRKLRKELLSKHLRQQQKEDLLVQYGFLRWLKKQHSFGVFCQHSIFLRAFGHTAGSTFDFLFEQ